MKRIVYKMLKKKKIVYKIIWTNVTRTNDAWTLDKCPKHLVSSHFCELRLHAKFQLPRLSRNQKKRWAPGGWRVGGSGSRIMPRCGSILQVGTCQILS